MIKSYRKKAIVILVKKIKFMTGERKNLVTEEDKKWLEGTFRLAQEMRQKFKKKTLLFYKVYKSSFLFILKISLQKGLIAESAMLIFYHDALFNNVLLLFE